LRALFGRTVLAFPNLFLPTWQIEGLATWEESALAGEGRLHAGDFRAIEREAARGGRVDPLDRINGGLTNWPGGLAPYAYGLGLHQYLADRFGDEAFARLASQTARSLPFTSSRAFRKVYGQSLGSLWRAYVSDLEQATAGDSVRIASVTKRLTHHGYVVLGPRFAPPLCPACSENIVYSVRGPDGFPALRSVLPDGSGSVQLATRYLGSTAAPASEVIVFDQQELRRSAGLYSDLFALDRRTGRVRELTREARLRDPDLSPDGRTLACVREGRGARELVLVRVSSNRPGTAPPAGRSTMPTGRLAVSDISVLVSEADTQFDVPRWSPDGRSIVAERHKRGALSEIVVVEVQTGAVRVVAADLSARIVTPTWRRDGRAVVAAAEFGDRAFNLYEFSTDDPTRPARQLTDTTGGATWPDVSPDGQTIVFVGYTADGFDLFTMPYPSDDGRVAHSPRLPGQATTTDAPGDRQPPLPDPAGVRVYSPWATLRPMSWTPVLEGPSDRLGVGLAVSGKDVLARHVYAASATWLIKIPENAVGPHRGEPDWWASYGYDRWRPTLFLSASGETLFAAGPSDASGRPSSATLRERSIQAGVLVPLRHVRAASRALVSLVGGSDDYTFAAGRASVARASVRAAWATNTSHLYGYSISPEGGVSVGTTAELTRRALGASADATAVTADARGYLPGAGIHHVVAVRAAGAASMGSADLGRTYHMGGAAPGGDVIDFGRNAISLMRGFPSDTFAGRRVVLVNAEYRWPIVRPQRGVGTWPMFLHTVHAAAFADAGHAWTKGFRLEDAKISAGAELAIDVVAGYSFPLTTALGIAWGRDGARPDDRPATFYVRLGRSF
jgi:Tol biopolymer transport system component